MVDVQQPFEGACVGCDYAGMAEAAGEQEAATAVRTELARQACGFIKTGKCDVATFLTGVALQQEPLDITTPTNKD